MPFARTRQVVAALREARERGVPPPASVTQSYWPSKAAAPRVRAPTPGLPRFSLLLQLCDGCVLTSSGETGRCLIATAASTPLTVAVTADFTYADLLVAAADAAGVWQNELFGLSRAEVSVGSAGTLSSARIWLSSGTAPPPLSSLADSTPDVAQTARRASATAARRSARCCSTLNGWPRRRPSRRRRRALCRRWSALGVPRHHSLSPLPAAPQMFHVRYWKTPKFLVDARASALIALEASLMVASGVWRCVDDARRCVRVLRPHLCASDVRSSPPCGWRRCAHDSISARTTPNALRRLASVMTWHPTRSLAAATSSPSQFGAARLRRWLPPSIVDYVALPALEAQLFALYSQSSASASTTPLSPRSANDDVAVGQWSPSSSPSTLIVERDPVREYLRAVRRLPSFGVAFFQATDVKTFNVVLVGVGEDGVLLASAAAPGARAHPTRQRLLPSPTIVGVVVAQSR